jgi:hypothetical protein
MALLRRTRSAGIVCAVALALLAASAYYAATPAVAASHAPILSTQQIHAAFTLNLTKFVTWPASAFASDTAPFVIGTFPRDLINDRLDAAARGEMVGSHPVQTVRIQSLDDVAKCHVIFLSKGNTRQAAVLERAARRPILTVSDADGFLELGGHVEFLPQSTNVRLSISVDNLKASGLEARSQLLRIATRP